MEITEIVSLISNAVTGLSAVAVAIIAWRGLRAWREELKGKTQYEAVRQVLLLTRKFRAALSRSRSIFTYPSEAADRPRSEDETPEQARILDSKYARSSRLQPAADVIADMEQAAWEAEIATGEEIIPQLRPFAEVVRELDVAIWEYFSIELSLANVPPGITPTPDPRNDLKGLWKIICESSEDELTGRVDEALEALEQRLRKYIR